MNEMPWIHFKAMIYMCYCTYTGQLKVFFFFSLWFNSRLTLENYEKNGRKKEKKKKSFVFFFFFFSIRGGLICLLLFIVIACSLFHSCRSVDCVRVLFSEAGAICTPALKNVLFHPKLFRKVFTTSIICCKKLGGFDVFRFGQFTRSFTATTRSPWQPNLVFLQTLSCCCKMSCLSGKHC